MAGDQGNKDTGIETFNVRKVPKFNQAGGPKQWVYTVHMVTKLGNAGTFEVPSETYESDTDFPLWVQEAVFQLDKGGQLVG